MCEHQGCMWFVFDFLSVALYEYGTRTFRCRTYDYSYIQHSSSRVTAQPYFPYRTMHNDPVTRRTYVQSCDGTFIDAARMSGGSCGLSDRRGADFPSNNPCDFLSFHRRAR